MCNEIRKQSDNMNGAASAQTSDGFRVGVSGAWLMARREFAAKLSIEVAYANVQLAIVSASGVAADEAIEEVFDLIGADAMRLGSSDFSWGMHFPPVHFKDSKFLLGAWKMGYCAAAADESIARLEAGIFRENEPESAVCELERIFACKIKS
ncbi:hypothetical protein [Massilia sp.]|uniref:hypothetical protein n=1 Tax=Massilia sp. TaxID=1882437 RepID=UPI00352BF9AC